MEEEGRERTALLLHRKRLVAAPQLWTFTMASEGKGWKRSRDSSATQWPALPSRQAEAKMESQEVRRLKSRGLAWFTIGLTHSIFRMLGVCCF